MEDLNSSFWLGLAAAIPLSIVANLLTPKIQQWLSKRSESKYAKRVAELRSEYERVEKLTKNPDALHTYLLQQILFIAFFTSSVIAITGVLSFAMATSLGKLIEISGAISIARFCIEAIRDANRVRKFDRYKERIESEIGKIPLNEESRTV